MRRPWQLIRIAALVLGCLTIAGYAAFEARGIAAGPELVVTTPAPGSVFVAPLVNIAGTAERVSKITLNGRSIYVSEVGVFDETIAVNPGYNEALVEAWDRFGKRAAVTIPIMYRPE